MKIYVASSWRNEARQQEVVKTLRSHGHEVYDFRNPAPGDKGFSWRDCVKPEERETHLKDARLFRDVVLKTERAKKGFNFDMGALFEADATVLVLPCGRSAHLEMGFATGQGQKTIVLLTDPIDEPELMYLMCNHIAVTIEEVVRFLGEAEQNGKGVKP